MAAGADSEPLLANEEETLVHKPRTESIIKSLYDSAGFSRRRIPHIADSSSHNHENNFSHSLPHSNSATADSDSAEQPYGNSSIASEKQWKLSASASSSNVNAHCYTEAQNDGIIAIFVIAFDTKAGNIVEWCIPEDSDLENIEFKAMASGSHTLHTDFVYFRKDAMYGLSCFENMPVESEIERGARMKSVGILATSYTVLHRHMQFLETQVRHQLETPGNYSQLEAFYEDKKGVLLPRSASVMSNNTASSSALSATSDISTSLKISHPSGCFSQFMKFFGVKIFTLWKFSLLQKRILFFSPPPIGVVCYRVYCVCCLTDHYAENSVTDNVVRPYFYVNVSDIEALETEVAYVACTTEKIFETKTELYDLYVNNQNLTIPNPALKDLLKISDADRDKYARLTNQRSALLYDDGEVDEEDMFTTFFLEQNNRLFQTLLDVSGSHDRQLTGDHMRQMGLDPTGDRAFLMELVETYGIDVMLMVDNPCCPK